MIDQSHSMSTPFDQTLEFRFCPKCGAILELPEVTPEPDTAPESKPEPVAAPVPTHEPTVQVPIVEPTDAHGKTVEL